MYLNAVSVSLDCLFLQVANKLVAISGTEEIHYAEHTHKHTWGGREGPVGFENDKLELKCANVMYTLHGISTFFQWPTLCSNDGNLEERSRSPEL